MLLRSAGAKFSAPLGSGVFMVLGVNVYVIESSIIKRMIIDVKHCKAMFLNRKIYVSTIARQYHKRKSYVNKVWSLMFHYFNNPQYFEDIINLSKLLRLINNSLDIYVKKTSVKPLYPTGLNDVNNRLLYEGDIVKDTDTGVYYRVVFDSDYEVCIQKIKSAFWDLDSPDNKHLVFERSYNVYEDNVWDRPWHY